MKKSSCSCRFSFSWQALLHPDFPRACSPSRSLPAAAQAVLAPRFSQPDRWITERRGLGARSSSSRSTSACERRRLRRGQEGQSRQGLSRDDFEILEDNKPIAITNFYVVDDGIPMPTGEVPAAPAPEAVPGVPGCRPRRRGSTPAPVVYIDNFNMHPFSRNRSSALREFLRSDLTPGDR